MRILFIDDKVDEMRVHQRELEAIGHSVGFIDNLNEAYQILSQEKNQILYDAIFIDHDFSGSQGQIQNGMELIASLKAEYLLCPIIYFSAVQGDVEEVTKVISSYGACTFYKKSKFDGNQIKCINEIRELSSYKRIIELRNIKIKENLRSFFQTLSQQQAFLWQMELEKGENTDWNNFEAVIFGEKYKIDELLFNPVNPLSKEQKMDIIKDIIQKVRRIPKLSKTFLSDSESQINWYLGLPDNESEDIEKDIAHYAQNYFLNALLVSTESLNKESVYPLNNRNIGISRATEKINKITLNELQKKQLFIQKMALRRVTGLFYYYSVWNISFQLQSNLIACLLKSGKTHLNDSYDSDYEDQKIVWNWLGLTTLSLSMIISEYNSRIRGYRFNNPFKELFFNEEVKWIQSMVYILPEVRKCLDDIYQTLKNNFTSLLPISDSEYFSDSTDFKIWYLETIKKLRNYSPEKVGDINNIIKINAIKYSVQTYFCNYFTTTIAHFGAGRLGLGLVAPIINQLGDKIVIINRFSKEWQNCKEQDIITIESNGIESTYKFYHQDLSNDKKAKIFQEWAESCKMKLIVAVDYEKSDEIGPFLKDVQHITTSLKTGLNRIKGIIENVNFNNLVTIYPFENNKNDVSDFYKDLNGDRFEKSLLIADRVCTHTELNPESNKLMVYAEKYGNVVINGSKVGNNLFSNNPSLKGVDYIFCEDKDEFEFHFNKKFRILNCVHASLAVMCYDKVMDKIPKDKWGEQYINLLNDGQIKSDIEKVASAEILKLMTTTNEEVMSRVFPSKNISEVYMELKEYSNTIFDRFDGMADRLDRVLNLDDLIEKFDARIDDTINFFDGSNDTSLNTIVNKIHTVDRPNIKAIDKTLRDLLRKVSKINRKRNVS